MTSRCRCSGGSTGAGRRDETGAVLVVALGIVLVLVMLSIVAVSATLHGLTQAADVRKHVQLVGAAEAGLDAELTNVQAAVNAGNTSVISCPSSVHYIDVAPGSQYGSVTASGAGNQASIEGYTLQYAADSSQARLAGDPLQSCTAGKIVTAYSGTWYLEVVATSTSSSDAMGTPDVRRATVAIQPSSGALATSASVDKAIFANNGYLGDGAVAIYSDPSGRGPADVYANAPFDCSVVSGSTLLDGESIEANPGGGPASNSVTGACSVETYGGQPGNVYDYNGNVNLASPTVVYGSVYADNGNVTVASGSFVQDNIYASGSISYSSCGSNNCFPNSTPPNTPAPEQFPVVDDTDLTPWAGYTQYITASCDPSGFMAYASAHTSEQNMWVVSSACTSPITFTGAYTVPGNMAIFAASGFYITNATFNGNPSALLSLIVPYSAAATPPAPPVCPTLSNPPGPEKTDIILTGGSGGANYFYTKTFLYTPCDFSSDGATTMYGQVYAGGTWNDTGSLTQYVRMAAPPSGAAVSYSGPAGPASAKVLNLG